MSLPATFNGTSDWQGAPPCTDIGGDLTYTICVVASVPTQTTPSSTGRAMYSASSGTASKLYASIGLPDNSLAVDFTHRDSSTFYSVRTTSGAINDGLEHKFAATSDGFVLRLYIDGQEVGTPKSIQGATPIDASICTYGALRRAGTPPAVSSYWNGEIRLAQTWDRALSAYEVETLCGGPPVAQNPCTAPPSYGKADGLPPCINETDTHCALPCSFDRQKVQGGCDECFTWDDVASAEWYAIDRFDAQTGVMTPDIGTTKTKPEPKRGMWCPAWDNPMPVAGNIYGYYVRSCKVETAGPAPHAIGDDLCGAQSLSITYRAACHDCDGKTPSYCPGTEP